MDNWMVDVETTGLRPDKHAILSIGAVKFDDEFRETGLKFFIRLKVPEIREWDTDTLNWWLEQSPEAYEAAISPDDAVEPREALKMFANCINRHDTPVFWAKPAHFDFPFIESYFNEWFVKSPFHYRRVVDVRSYVAGLGRKAVEAFQTLEKGTKPELSHHPVSDCQWQLTNLRIAAEIARSYA